MSEIETLGLLEEIQALVSDKLQVVSYKWLSRNFLVPSHAAKRLLAKFAEKHGSGIEVVYTLSGWSKGSSPSYLVKLIPGPKLAESKQEFDGNCSVQVYSVQACIPKDPVVLWNAEFLQAERLFMQPSDLDNCLRDNRFCSILNPNVHRSIDGATVLHTIVQPKSGEVSGSSLPNNQDTKGTNVGGVSDEITKPLADEGKVPSFTSTKQKEPSVKSSSAAGGSLANLWGRASVKSKPDDSVKSDVSADAQISAREAVEDGSSDDNDQDVSYQRLSSNERNRKRQVVFDMSDDDECEEAVKLAAPSPPRMQPCLDAKQSSGPLLKKANLIDAPQKAKKLKEIGAKVKDEPRDEHKAHLQPKEDKPKLKEERTADKEINCTSTIEVSAVNGGKAPMSMVENLVPEADPNKDKVAAAARSSPQRKKVLKTRIDERGREVTEVVWEGRDMEVKKAESVTKSNHDTNATANMVANSSRPAATKKSPALGSTNAGGKTGNKKAQGGKGPNPKQGNLLSYFKAK